MKNAKLSLLVLFLVILGVSNVQAANGDLMVNGNMGIGANPSTQYKLYVAGAAYATIVWQSSDLSLKENIAPIESSLQKLLNVKGVSFTWKQEGNEHRGFPGGKHNGVIAQDIQKVLPEVVQDGPDGEKAVSYTELIPILIEAMKEQHKIIEKQQSDMKTLTTAIEEIKAKK